jgi:hypothetical protein
LGIPQTSVTMQGDSSIEIMFDSKELAEEEMVKKVLPLVEPRFDSAELKKGYEELLEEMKDE